ncbi:MAG: hypothetical protein C0625_16775 [Arcobacter sp.]|nr:MAG: hypothetical protein C0625_16775 [Arcobacter sp.]
MKNKIIVISLMVTLIVSSLIIFILSNHIKDNKALVKDIVNKEALAYFNNILSTRHWNARYNGVYVKQEEGITPNEYLKDNQTYTKDGQLLIKIDPSSMIREISEISNKTNKNYLKITSLNPLNPNNNVDEFEKRALLFFEKNTEERFFSEISEDFSRYNFMGSLKVTKSCLECHIEQGYKEGDIRGGIHISIPTNTYFEKLSEIETEHNYLVIGILFTALIIFILFLWFINKFFYIQETIKRNYKYISNLKKRNDELLSRYEYAVDGTTDGLWDWNLKTNEIYFSKNWKKMLGYEDDEIENDISEWEKRIHPDDKEQAIKDIQNNNNKVTEYYQNIHRLKHKNGTWVWILDRGRTHFDKDGNAKRMVGFHSNITEIKNLEISLADTKQELTQLKIVIENAPIGIMIVNTKANITYVNPSFCEASGYTKLELIGLNPKILRFDEDDDLYAELWKTIKNKKTWGGVIRNKKKNYSDYWSTVTILPILNQEGNIISYLSLWREITKEVYLQKMLNEKEELMLSQSKNAAMGEMISMIAHQLRQPITTISMNANNIIADIELEMFNAEETKKIALNISEQTQFLSKTIDDFRNFFKEDKNIDEFKFKILFDELSSIILASLKNNDIEFNVVCDKDIIIKTFKRELLQVLLNIIKNAKEALTEESIEKKVINVEVEDLDTKIKITISDNAGGIKQENLDRIFDAYFTTKDEYNGTGLGLYMSKMIIEKHLSGSLEVRNNNQGAEFTIILYKSCEIE